MDVRRIAYLGGLALFFAGLEMGPVTGAAAAPAYRVIDLGTGSLDFGSDSTGTGTVTASNGLTYAFNPTRNHLPISWASTSEGIPTVSSPPVNSADTNGNPRNAYSFTRLTYMNGEGLAAGVNPVGVKGHEGFSSALFTQLRPDGTWGPATSLWAGAQTFQTDGVASNVGILGVSSSGQILGYGLDGPWSSLIKSYLYDVNTGSRIDLTDLVNASTWASAQPPSPAYYRWLVAAVAGQLDDQGRVLVQATWGYEGPAHNLLLVPDGVPADPLSVPEPATWSVFAVLIGGWVGVRRWPARARQAHRRAS